MTQIFLTALLGTAILGLNAAGALSNQNERSIEYLSILDKTWQRESTITPVEKIAVPNPERYTILLEANGKVQVRFDCNRGGGGYKISESKLSFSPLRSTRMACPPGTLEAPS